MRSLTRSLLGIAFCAGCETQELQVFELPFVPGGTGSGGVAGMAEAGTGGSSPVAGSASGAAAGGTSGMSGSAGADGGGAGAGAGDTSGAGGMPAATTCASHSDCMPGWQCEKPGCDAAVGECQPQPPFFCPPEPLPVCGCNGVTYWNDCVRRQTGAQVASAGECPATAAPCQVGTDCIPGAFCAHLLQGGSMCGGPPSLGMCWVVPKCRYNPVDELVWQECQPPHAPPGPCLDACLAIGTERPHVRKTRESCR